MPRIRGRQDLVAFVANEGVQKTSMGNIVPAGAELGSRRCNMKETRSIAPGTRAAL
jgi:hypothetical protein